MKQSFSNKRSSFLNHVINNLTKIDLNTINKISDEILNTSKNKGVIYLFGNGASASISDHLATDLTKVCNIKSRTFNNSNLITCFSNDYGYENLFKEAIKFYVQKKDLCIFVSSSGESKNVIKAAEHCNKNSIKSFSFTGFKKNNSLSKITSLNFYVASRNYNVVETVHQTALLSIVEKLSK